MGVRFQMTDAVVLYQPKDATSKLMQYARNSPVMVLQVINLVTVLQSMETLWSLELFGETQKMTLAVAVPMSILDLGLFGRSSPS